MLIEVRLGQTEIRGGTCTDSTNQPYDFKTGSWIQYNPLAVKHTNTQISRDAVSILDSSCPRDYRNSAQSPLLRLLVGLKLTAQRKEAADQKLLSAADIGCGNGWEGQHWQCV